MIAKAQSTIQAIRQILARPQSALGAASGLLLLSEAAYLALVRLDAVSAAGPVFTFLALLAFLFLCYGAVYLILRNLQNHRATVFLIVFGALLFRATMLFAGLPHDSTWKERLSATRADVRGEAVAYDRFLLYDNDVWRYLWDGHVWANRINPYLYEPANSRLDTLARSEEGANPLWSDVRGNVNHPQVPTLYPPFAESIFRVAHTLAPGSVFVMKSIFAGFDLVALIFVALTLRVLNRPAADLVLYAWNPLLIKAVAGSGHMDAVVAVTLAATAYFIIRGSHTSAAIAWGLSVLAKIGPIVLLPFLIRRLGWRKSGLGIATIAPGYLPFLSAGVSSFAGLRIFAERWQFNSGFFSLIRWLAGPFSDDPGLVAKGASGAAFLLLMGYLILKDDGKNGTFALHSVTALGGLIVLGSTVMPWYMVWLLPLAVIGRARIWIYFSALVCLAFLVMLDGVERTSVLLLEYGLFALLLFREYPPFRRMMQAGRRAQKFIPQPQMLNNKPKTLIGEKL